MAVTTQQISGRLACFWFLLTAIGMLWIWPIIAASLVYFKNLWLTTAFLGYMAYNWYGPGERSASSGAWPTPLRRWSLWQLMAAYFSARLVKTADLDPAGHYLFAAHPHGIISISMWLNFATDATEFSRLFPGLDLRVATLESNLRVPFLREYILLHGLVGASRETIRSILSSKRPGKSTLIVVGGASEALLAAPGTYDLVLHSRRGFVRLALQTGASLVPVIAYGETDTFNTYIPPPSSNAKCIMSYIKKRFGVSTPLCWGVGLFGGWGILPLQCQLTTVVGNPLPAEKVVNPSDEQVERLHSAYLVALTQLWRDTSEQYGGKGIQRGLAVVQ